MTYVVRILHYGRVYSVQLDRLHVSHDVSRVARVRMVVAASTRTPLHEGGQIYNLQVWVVANTHAQ